MSQMECFDVTIIGGGPAGLYSAFYSGLREMKTKIIEFQPYLGGKIHVYPEKMIWDVGGLTPLSGAKLIEQTVKQGLTFDPEVVLNEQITSIKRDTEGYFTLIAASGSEHYSKTVIVAVGSGILKPQKLAIEGAELFEVSNLHYTIKSLNSFKDKTVIISGGGNSAIDWAIELEPVAKKVYLAHRRANLTGHEAQITHLMNGSVTCFFNTSITKLKASIDCISIDRVELTNHETGDSFELPIDDVVVHHGFEQDASLLTNSGLSIELVDQFFIKGNAKSESTIPGLYACGDILNYEGKVHLIAGAFQDAANAVNQAKRFIEPKAEATAMVSSHNDLFKKRNVALIQQQLK
ncbi:NAD(P)/FAD-dependent oxidoreductase [Pullulanibacillus sp. KACC 23026]|uniref:NAD(P)/FAD-dependent oxidoreductase n=1 Tax=Pullulanibacillus sp. KACC 23026 TaxID=3028315 RepID=UPI0023AF577F|nr:NAD(P)/FAD-dependent oxidoreductase [Pullulanibacillus sp. KACC 23026]WEG14442.1 NAD(P)/FAD-dependent oxidoreductase [Pullulanibacillus sp. KACC 23026]